MAVIQKIRKSFGKSFLQTPLPDLVEIQYDSYKDFLQADVEPQNRKISVCRMCFLQCSQSRTMRVLPTLNS